MRRFRRMMRKSRDVWLSWRIDAPPLRPRKLRLAAARNLIRSGGMSARSVRIIATRRAYIRGLPEGLVMLPLGGTLSIVLLIVGGPTQGSVVTSAGYALYALTIGGTFTLLGMRSRRRHPRLDAIVRVFELYATVYTLANFEQFLKDAQRKARTYRKRTNEWRRTSTQLRCSIADEAWNLSLALAKDAGYPASEAVEARFSTEARILLWCAGEPALRLKYATEVAAHASNHLLSSLAAVPPRKLHARWLTPARYEALPELSDVSTRARLRRAVGAIGNFQLVGPIILATAALVAATIRLNGVP
jgi:hypothetical protein